MPRPEVGVSATLLGTLRRRHGDAWHLETFLDDEFRAIQQKMQKLNSKQFKNFPFESLANSLISERRDRALSALEARSQDDTT